MIVFHSNLGEMAFVNQTGLKSGTSECWTFCKQDALECTGAGHTEQPETLYSNYFKALHSWVEDSTGSTDMTNSMVIDSFFVIHILRYQHESSFSAFQWNYESCEVQTSLLLALSGVQVSLCQGALFAWLALFLHVTSDVL